MKNIQERVFPLVRQLKGFVCADGVKIDNCAGGELGIGWMLIADVGNGSESSVGDRVSVSN